MREKRSVTQAIIAVLGLRALKLWSVEITEKATNPFGGKQVS